jgi:hypothetical protein
MTLNKGVEVAIDQRRQFVASLLARNSRLTRRQIHALLARPTEEGGLRNPVNGKPYSVTTIHFDVIAVLEEWRQMRLRSADEWIAKELAIYEELQIQAWRQDNLSEVRRISETRRKLLGLDAPTKIAPTMPDGLSPYEGNMLRVFEVVHHGIAEDEDESSGDAG